MIRPERRGPSAQIAFGNYTFTKKGVGRFDLRDPYHLAVALSWPQFLLTLLSLYLAANLVFATLYTLVPGSVANAKPHNFPDAFFFSFETLATVGYGEMYPGNLYGHLVACVEIVCGLAFTAILTGLTFVRFSRPRAKFIFAAKPVVAVHDGCPTLMLRVANGRASLLSDAHAKLNVVLSWKTREGARFRSAQELRLLRAHLPIFPLTWTLMHPMDEKSPLHGFDAAQMEQAEARLFVTLEAYDPTLSSVVHQLRDYEPTDLRFGMRYADAVSDDARGSPVADLTRISALEPDAGADRPEPGWIAEQQETEVDQSN